MRDAWLLFAAVLCNVVGFAWLAFAMDVHWRQVRGSLALARKTLVLLRSIGAAALALSLFLCLRVDHVSMAALVWIMSLAASALIVALMLAWRPGWLAVLIAPLSSST